MDVLNAIFSNLNLFISLIVAFGIIEFLKKSWRQYKLKKPIESHFIIPRKDLFKLSYVKQDKKEHHVNKLILPTNTKCHVILWNKPRIEFQDTQIQFACGGKYKERPRAIEWFNPYIKSGKNKQDKPRNNKNHYIDWWNNYHIEKQQYRNRDTVYMTGFLVETLDEGVFDFNTLYHTPTKGGRSKLTIEVRSRPYNEFITCVKYKNEKKQKGKHIVMNIYRKVNRKNHFKKIKKILKKFDTNFYLYKFLKKIYKKYDFHCHFKHTINFI